MKQYYVVDKENKDFDLDAETSYTSFEEAKFKQIQLERDYPGTKFEIWEVD